MEDPIKGFSFIIRLVCIKGPIKIQESEFCNNVD